VSATACGDPICAARVQMSISDPEDSMIRKPCSRCVDALAYLLDAGRRAEDDFARTMRSCNNVIVGRL
jgi:hypothetical protein